MSTEFEIGNTTNIEEVKETTTVKEETVKTPTTKETIDTEVAKETTTKENTETETDSITVDDNNVRIEEGAATLIAGSETDTKKLASAIFANIHRYGRVRVHGVSPTAVGIALNATLTARGNLMNVGKITGIHCSKREVINSVSGQKMIGTRVEIYDKTPQRKFTPQS